MTTPWNNCVNQNFGVSVISDVNNYINNITISDSPIDSYYNTVTDMIRLATPTFIATHNWAGSLILVGIISATENYFRDVISKVMGFCPISKSCSTNKTINLGSVVWHNGVNFERGALEHIALSAAKNIRETSKDFIQYEILSGNSLYSLTEEYGKVCEMRHGIVHSNSIFSGKNALKLGIVPNGNILKINIGYNELQESAAICTALIATYNSQLFNEMIERWAHRWRRLYPHDSTTENKIFKRIWELFYSKTDAGYGLITNTLTMIKCRNSVKRFYNI